MSDDRLLLTCPCAEVLALKKEVEFLKDEIQRILIKEIVHDRKRITTLEESFSEASKASATQGEQRGTWGVVDKRAEEIYLQLLAAGNGNRHSPFLSTIDIRRLLGIRTCWQAKLAMIACQKLHPETVIIERHGKRLGISKVTAEEQKNDKNGRKKLW